MSSKRDLRYTILVHGATRVSHVAIERALVSLCEAIAESRATDGCAYDVQVIRECEPGRPADILTAIRDLLDADDDGSAGPKPSQGSD